MTAGRPHIGFVFERSLGHVTHAETLAELIAEQPQITADVRQIDYAVDGIGAKIPGFRSNWTLRAGLRARRVVRSMNRTQRLDGLFVHTQVPAVLMPDRLARIPTVVSLDATPLQYDELGADYDHAVGHPRVEQLKWRANRAVFRRARRVVTWSTWAKQGVVDGYGIDADKVTVLPPGVDPALWRRPESHVADPSVVRVLFVGGDLERKGGDVLIEAVQAVRAARAETGQGPELQLDLVTRAAVPEQPGVRVHRGMAPNSPELVALFHDADIFALPTRADCLGIALLEAGAAGLPLISTAIAGVPEIVKADQTGLVVPPADREALVGSLNRLIDDPALRRRLGDGAASLVAQRFDAETNATELVDLIVAAIGPAGA